MIPAVTHSDVGVNLLLQTPDLGEVLPDCFLEVQDAATLLLGVARNLQLEAHTLLLLAVLLQVDGIKFKNDTFPSRLLEILL